MDIKTTRPNFLVCVVDQMQSYSIGYNGNNEVSTPNIDTIAKEGVSFMRAYCNNPVCMPSRATMLTGLTPKQHGCITNGTILNTQIPTVTKALVDNGYRTHLVGKPHLQPFGATGNNGENEKFSWESKIRWDKEEIKSLPKMYYGFETSDFVGGHGEYCFGDYVNWLKKNHSNIYEKYKQDNSYFKNEKAPSSWRMDLPHELHYNNWIVDKSIEFINDIKQDQNFFLWCSFPDPHHPFAACKPYSEMYDPKEVSLNPNWQEEKDFLQHLKNRRKQFSYNNQFDEEGLREIVSQTYGMITHIDDNIGRLIDALKNKGLEDNTIVVFMADHGEYLGSHHLLTKDTWPYEEMIRVPYIWKVPDSFETKHSNEKEKNNEDVVSLLDFVPTVLDYANISQDVMDLRQEGKAEKIGLPGRSLKKYLSNKEKLEAKPAIIEYDEDWHKGPFYRERVIVYKNYKLAVFPIAGGKMLFDLENDPHETINLYDNKDYRDIKEELMEKLLFELVRTDRMDQARICGA